MPLKIGDKAYDFSLLRDGGETMSLKDIHGKKSVIYFYPKDNTPGCTTEAKDFSKYAKDFEAAGAIIIGVSKDSVRRHGNFKEKHGLNLILLADTDGEMVENYGVWVEKQLYGRKYMGIQRATFLLDEEGVIRNIWPKVRVKDHAGEVLAAVKSL